MVVNVEPGTRVGGIVGSMKLVTAGGGLLVTSEGDKVGEPELVSGGWEESGGLEEGKSEGSIKGELGS